MPCFYTVIETRVEVWETREIAWEHEHEQRTGQRGRVVYEQIVDEGETRVDYLLIDNEAELSNCFSINHHIKYKLGCINEI